MPDPGDDNIKMKYIEKDKRELEDIKKLAEAAGEDTTGMSKQQLKKLGKRLKAIQKEKAAEQIDNSNDDDKGKKSSNKGTTTTSSNTSSATNNGQPENQDMLMFVRSVRAGAVPAIRIRVIRLLDYHRSDG